MFIIKQNSKDPIFEQICSQMKHFISIGVMEKGEKLPSVRSLAEELGINPNTVVKAYSYLENEGVIISSYKRGYFVSEKDVEDEWKQKELKLFKDQIMKLKALSVKKNELEKIILNVYDEGGIKHAENK